MARKDRNKEKAKPNSFSAFLKKRAPVYLGIMGLFLVFVIPQLTSNSLEGLFPEDLSDGEREALNAAMSYDGPNNEGLTVLEALDTKIKEKFSDDRILDDKSAEVLVSVTETGPDTADLVFTFQSSRGGIEYTWNVNTESGKIKGADPESESIVDLVDFYD